VQDSSGKPSGPYRVFDNYGIIGGLAISRSIGDHSLTRSGVIPDPELIDHEINENDKYLIIASDGVWEFLSNEDILQVIQRTSSATKNVTPVKQRDQSISPMTDFRVRSNCGEISHAKSICENIIKLSKYYWEESEHNYRDDITVIVAILNP